MNKFKIVILILIFFVKTQVSIGQRLKPPSKDQCCCLMSMLPFVLASYNLTFQYGNISNPELGKGNSFGGEFAWFPLQSLGKERKRLAYGLKLAYNNSVNYGNVNSKMSGFIETDFFFRKLIDKSRVFIDPYIGVDIGITDGYIKEQRSNFKLAPIAGMNFTLKNGLSVIFNTRHLYIFEKPQTKIWQFNIGVQIDLISRL